MGIDAQAVENCAQQVDDAHGTFGHTGPASVRLADVITSSWGIDPLTSSRGLLGS